MKMFDYVCPAGHKEEELFRSDETIPDEKPCEKCAKDGVENAIMTRVRLYPVPGVMLPSAPASY